MADRESFIPESFTAGSSFTSRGDSQNSGSGGAGGAGSGGATSNNLDYSGPVTQYECGDCAQKVLLKKGDRIRCSECGHRILYKERTKRLRPDEL